MERGGWTYILASGPHGTLYTGVTASLGRRHWQHTEGPGGSAFCRRYGVTQLVWFQHFEDIRGAIHREKRIKKWPRRWKVRLIEEANPHWRDLSATLNDEVEWIAEGLIDLALLKLLPKEAAAAPHHPSSSPGRPKADPGEPSDG